MRSLRRQSFVALVATAFFASSLQSAARAGVIGTEQYMSSLDREATLARINTVLAREEVRTRLEHYGVDPAAADARIAALTDAELEQLATELDNLPAGGSLLGVVGIAFIVLLILELVGVIDIFKKI
jgi:hypothetical protein